jgi:hypothetical protein
MDRLHQSISVPFAEQPGTSDLRARLRSRHPTLQYRRTFEDPPRPVPISGPMSRR